METVQFTRMKDGTAEEFELVAENDECTARELPDRVMAHMQLLREDQGPYPVDRLQHSLQAATRAERDGADESWVVAALLHDLGDVLAPHAHGELGALILRPFVRSEVEWVVRVHGLFQQRFFANHTQAERDAHLQLRDHPHFEAAMRFTERWDQCSFDPDHDTRPLEHFDPTLRRVLTRRPCTPADRED